MPRTVIRTTTKPSMSWHFRQLPFWERIEAQLASDGDCIIFTGSKDECGYGRVADSRHGPAKRRLVRVHRAMWERHNGAVPSGFEVCHTCDMPSCVNIEHLFLGTHADNIHDMDSKGRRRVLRGSGQRQAKLTENDISDIRMMLGFGASCKTLGEAYGVTLSLISHIKNGRNWSHA